MAISVQGTNSFSRSELHQLGERIDRLMTVEARPMHEGLPSGLVVPMYTICRQYHAEPLSTLAAQRLASAIKEGDNVIIATGAGVPPKLPKGETDGPPGAIVLARAIALGLGAHVTVVAEENHFEAVKACVYLANAYSNVAIAAETIPADKDLGVAAVKMLVKKQQPAAIIFIELDGPNEHGLFHGVRGDRRPPETVANLYRLADIARKIGILTVGIGDGGNEVGFGSVRNALALIHPNQFVVTKIETDIIVSSAISNWGAYAVAAALAVILNRPELLHDSDLERELINSCIIAGALDGATAEQGTRVDGVDVTGHCAFVQLLRTVVQISMSVTPPKIQHQQSDEEFVIQ